MKITNNILTKNRFSRPNKKLIGVRGVVIHWIGNAGTSALMNRNYFENLKNQRVTNNARYASAHFIIGLEGEIIQCLPANEWAYHVGARSYKNDALKRLSSYPNNCTLGIELCHPDWTGKFNDATIASAIELTALLLKQFNLTPNDIYRHYDITGKLCPKYFVENTRAWIEFKSSVEKYLISIL
ncbi:MAG: peptidoglycan recognition family protein [Treponemataceae bacterium]